MNEEQEEVLDPNAAIVLYPPMPQRPCSRCEHVALCRIHNTVTGHLLCEKLTIWDVVLAERDGVLQETIWWWDLPDTITAHQVLSCIDQSQQMPGVLKIAHAYPQQQAGGP